MGGRWEVMGGWWLGGEWVGLVIQRLMATSDGYRRATRDASYEASTSRWRHSETHRDGDIVRLQARRCSRTMSPSRSPKEPRGTQGTPRAPGSPKEPQETPKEPQGAPKNPRKPQGAPGSPREPQGAPKSPKEPQGAPGSMNEPKGASRSSKENPRSPK